MIHLITGNPGAKKTAYCVSLLDKIETSNKVNIVKNAKIYKNNMYILTQKELLDELTYFKNEIGTGETLNYEIEILPDDYFDFLGKDDFDLLRPDDYFKRSTRFNVIIERIIQNHGDIGLTYFLPVRTIYTNIESLRIDYVRSLVVDWRDCPDGSIIVIDEIQLVHPYSEVKERNNPIVTNLSVHRHRGFDFYFITQSAGNLHVLIKDLIAVHYHVTCPFGWKTKIFQYGEFKANPNAVSVKMSSEQSFYFTPSNHIFKLYKSTTINTAKARPPYKKIAFVLGIVFFGLFMTFFGFSVDDDKTAEEKINSKNSPNVIGNKQPEQEKTVSRETQSEVKKADIELTKEQLEEKLKLQEQQFKIEIEKQKIQMIMQYEQMQKQFLEQQEQMRQFHAKLEMYKTMLPKNYDIIKNDPNL